MSTLIPEKPRLKDVKMGYQRQDTMPQAVLGQRAGDLVAESHGSSLRASVNPLAVPIRKTPGVLGGDARIRDRRIAVWMLVQARRLGFTEPQILADYAPLLTQADLDAAWRYYQANPEEIDQAIHDNEDA